MGERKCLDIWANIHFKENKDRFINVVTMRLGGKTFKQIAEYYNISGTQARHIYLKASYRFRLEMYNLGLIKKEDVGTPRR